MNAPSSVLFGVSASCHDRGAEASTSFTRPSYKHHLNLIFNRLPPVPSYLQKYLQEMRFMASVCRNPRFLLSATCLVHQTPSLQHFTRTMSTTLKSHNIPLSLPDGLSEEQLTSFKPFTVHFSLHISSLRIANACRNGSTHSQTHSVYNPMNLTPSTKTPTLCAQLPSNLTISSALNVSAS